MFLELNSNCIAILNALAEVQTSTRYIGNTHRLTNKLAWMDHFRQLLIFPIQIPIHIPIQK